MKKKTCKKKTAATVKNPHVLEFFNLRTLFTVTKYFRSVTKLSEMIIIYNVIIKLMQRHQTLYKID
jgi:hypothetical protein